MSFKDLARRGVMPPTLAKTSREEVRDVISKILGFDNWNPAAPGMGTNRLSIANLLSLELPHQPLRRFTKPSSALGETRAFLSWMKSPPIEPGPALRYL